MSEIRVRFAPSPTGSLHLGGARTALFNWLFARNLGGNYVLRIEDTDRERSTAESEDQLIRSLRWLGLDWDEGPDCPGEHGPYRQSERMEIYRERAEDLLARGLAYRCFCSDEHLTAEREKAKVEKRDPVYDGRCAGIDPEEANRRAETEPHTLRFRMPQKDITIRDLVRGEVTFPAGMVGDFILLRKDGMPVYNFACAVDDGLMEISHVLRGEDHLSNSLRQVALYEAMNLPLPEFAHLSMILGEDRSKLSKRHGAVSVEAFREAGYPAEALLNALALLGWNPGDDRERMSLEEITEAFDIARVHKAAAVFDRDKLDWISGSWIRERSGEELQELARPHLPEEGERLPKILDVLKDRIHCFGDLPAEMESFRGDLPTPDEEAREWLKGAGDFLAALADALENREVDFKSLLKEVGKESGRKGKELFMPTRVALTGQTHGPDLGATAELLGRELVIERLRKARSHG
ncbi:MAG: glutamate--tRNA ligase [Candidatus Krumholzibacteria bacterium]|jgi:glutamyl-tRNA synthetase|nr:glutamate--tRNA ligase [Candidatus Krumholzibacteria bacterium]MDP6669522.1 glutamate--tRNA ligase [Candidatus Krumholzibacteria bacterium]MDP6797844.1 glutamate--tRNA ligase [Candidatus Krumholzibacteria bacterium]MDP7022522.1 glutamate--tRNA ligase [Candidatus Krumholzibacteria bacterium]